jgi:hypothetical protein
LPWWSSRTALAGASGAPLWTAPLVVLKTSSQPGLCYFTFT